MPRLSGEDFLQRGIHFSGIGGDQVDTRSPLRDRTHDKARWGNETILSVFGENQLFGETFAGSNDPVSSVSFYSARNTRVLSIPFHRIMHTCNMSCVFHHRIIENMVSLIADKNKQLMEKLEIVSQKTLRKKLLSYLSLQSQQNHGKSRFTIPMGRSELANYLNADRSALTRELTNMEKDGLISYEKNTFTLLR